MIKFDNDNPPTLREAYIIGKLLAACEKHPGTHRGGGCACHSCEFANWIWAKYDSLISYGESKKVEI